MSTFLNNECISKMSTAYHIAKMSAEYCKDEHCILQRWVLSIAKMSTVNHKDEHCISQR
jgi:hypothetical protein